MTMTTVRLFSTDDSTKVRTDTMTWVGHAGPSEMPNCEASQGAGQQLTLSFSLDQFCDDVKAWRKHPNPMLCSSCMDNLLWPLRVASGMQSVAFVSIHDLNNGQGAQ